MRLHSNFPEYIVIFNGYEDQIKNSVTQGTCSASWGLQNDSKQLSQMTEFSNHTEQLLWILFLAYSSFNNCIYSLLSSQEWKAWGIEQLRLPTVDFTATPTQCDIDKAVGFILGHRLKQNSVYVHCKAGRTRSATVVACYLVKVGSLHFFFNVLALQFTMKYTALRRYKQLSHLMRLWFYSSSINSFFQCACAAIHPLGLDVWCFVEPFV